MNIVRLRYADSPVFIDLPNITSQFEVAGRGNYHGGTGNQFPGRANLGFGGLSLRDTPTLSYHPREGREIAKALLTPLSADLFSVVNAGADIEQLLLMTLNDINDVPNAPRATILHPQVPDDNARFLRGSPLSWPALTSATPPSSLIGTNEEADEASDPIPAGSGPGRRPAERGEGRLRLPRPGRGQDDPAQAREGAGPEDPARVRRLARDVGAGRDLPV